MISSLSKNKKMTVEIDTGSLNSAQIRLIKSINTLLTHILTTQDEAEFFDGSAEFMRLCASVIKQSHFEEGLPEEIKIPYTEQALEYSVDVLQEYIAKAKVVSYDN